MREGWDTALDAQTDLLRSFNTIDGRDYLNGLAMLLGKAGRYNDATGEMVDSDPEYAERIVGDATARLPECEPFYVSDELTWLVDNAADGFEPEALLPTDLIAPNGFAYFGAPLYVTDTRGYQMPFRAFQWNTSPDSDRVLIVLYSHDGDGDPEDGQMATAPDGTSYYQTPSRRTVGGSDLAMEYVTRVRFGQDPPTVILDDKSIRDMLTHVKVFFRFCQQTIALPHRERVARPTWKRARATWKEIKEVVVFTLRRGKTREYEGDEREVEWSHRWFVRGHWRKQPYVERDDEGNKYTVTRQIWIATYLKGPDGKPIIYKRRAFELVR